MNMEIVFQILITGALAIWMTSLSIRAYASETPLDFDPLRKINKWVKVVVIFLKRFLFVLICFSVSLHFLVENYDYKILSVIVLGGSIAYLFNIIVQDRILRHHIALMDRVESLEKEIEKVKNDNRNQVGNGGHSLVSSLVNSEAENNT